MTPQELKENERRLDLIDRLKNADPAGVARILKGEGENECVAVARLADQIGQRSVGALVWNQVRRMSRNTLSANRSAQV